MADDDADAQALARCEELFNKYDADGGGTIDASELQALCFERTGQSATMYPYHRLSLRCPRGHGERSCLRLLSSSCR